MREINLSSRRKLKAVDAKRFERLEPGLFVDLATVVCSSGVIPQKELHECWQMANSVHREFPDTLRVADVAAGHGLLAWILVLLARVGDRPRPRTAVAVDITRPKSADILAGAFTARWPDLAESVHYVEGSVDSLTSDHASQTLFVSAHACGSLSDRVLLAALSSQSPFAIMPCCHSLRKQGASLERLALAAGMRSDAIDKLALSARVVGQPASIEQFRIDALSAMGYEVREASIQREITKFNRIIMGLPTAATKQGVDSTRHAIDDDGRIKRLGEIRAYETVRSFNVADPAAARALAQRPSREWRRSFDLSYWVDDAPTGERLTAVLEDLTNQLIEPCITRHVSVSDRYTDPSTQRLAFTYRIEIRSTSVALTKDDAFALRRELCRGLDSLAQLRG